MPFGIYEVLGGTYTLLVDSINLNDIVVGPARARGFLSPTSKTAALDDQGCLLSEFSGALGNPWCCSEACILHHLATSLPPIGSRPTSTLRIVVNITPYNPKRVHLAEIKGIWGYTYTHWRGHGQYWIPVMLKLQSLWLDVPRASLGIPAGVRLPSSFTAPPKPGRVHFEFFYVGGQKSPRVITTSHSHPLLSGDALAFFVCVMCKELLSVPPGCGGVNICDCDGCPGVQSTGSRKIVAEPCDE